MDFKEYLTKLKDNNKAFNVSLSGIGIVKVKIISLSGDILELEDQDGDNVFFLHYTSTIVVT